MAKNLSTRHGPPDDAEMALAALIRNTRTTKRPLSLPEIAQWLLIAIKGYGSIDHVADRIGLTKKMLSQFLAVTELDPSVQGMFASRVIDSIDLAVHLRKLSFQEQKAVGAAASRSEINTADVRAIHEFRKEHPDTPIDEIIEAVRTTRNTKEYIVEFVIRGSKTGHREIRTRFNRVLGDDNIVSFKTEGAIGTLVINSSGRSTLQQLAKRKQVSLVEIVSQIVQGEEV